MSWNRAKPKKNKLQRAQSNAWSNPNNISPFDNFSQNQNKSHNAYRSNSNSNNYSNNFNNNNNNFKHNNLNNNLNNNNNQNQNNNNNFTNNFNNNFNNNQIAVIISNYPPEISPDAVLQSVAFQASRINGRMPVYVKGSEFPSKEFQVFLQDNSSLDSFLSICGTFVYNNPIWIIKFPYIYDQISIPLSEIFAESICCGVVDLSDLQTRFIKRGANSYLVNFYERDFVEFLLFRLGSESRDRRFMVSTLIVNRNNIQNLNVWSPFFTFLPSLENIVAYQNPLQVDPLMSECPYITIECEKGVFKGGNLLKSVPGNNKPNQNQNQNLITGWSSNQNDQPNQNTQTGWNNNQNQNQNNNWNSQNQNQNNNWNNQNQNQNNNWNNQNQNQNNNWNNQNQNQNNNWNNQNQNQNNNWNNQNQNQNNNWNNQNQNQNNSWNNQNQNQNNNWNNQNQNQNNNWNNQNQNQNNSWNNQNQNQNNNWNNQNQNQNNNWNNDNQNHENENDDGNTGSWGGGGGWGGGSPDSGGMEPAVEVQPLVMSDAGISTEELARICSQNIIM